MKNRSVPADAILPHVVYRDLNDAIDWLTKTFGFTEHYRYGGPVSGAQLHLGNAWIMVSGPRGNRASPAQTGHGSQSLTVFVENVDAHYESTKAAGAKIVEDLNETIYGERQYGVEDFEGHYWLFSKHSRDVDPAEWGATVSND
jgi:uncharacterized glyoxalase superfamily protein PhnB